jgi:hypothetical protein
MNCLKLFTLVFLLVLGFQLHAQEVLPTESKALEKALDEIMLVQKRKDCIETMDRYKQNVKARKITDQHIMGIVKLGNALIERNMKRYNLFRYVIDVTSFFSDDNGLTSRFYDDWVDITLRILAAQPKNRTVDFENYLRFSRDFWKTGNIYDISKGSHKWRATTKNFRMNFVDSTKQLIY